MQIKPLSNNILLEVSAEEKTTKSGIVIPDTADKERPTRAKVVAVGPGKAHDGKVVPMSVRVGDQVLFKKYGPDEIEVEGKKYLICSEDEVLAVIE